MAARTRSLVSVFSYARSGESGSGRHERGRQAALVEMLAGGERRRRFDRVDAHDGAAQALLVRADARGQVGHRRLVSQLASQRFARRVELAALAADAARPRVFAERIDHRAAHAPFGERLELDAAILVEAVRRVDQADHAVLDQVADVDRIRHRRRHAPRERFDERQAGDDAAVVTRRQRAGRAFGLLVGFGTASRCCAISQWRYQSG